MQVRHLIASAALLAAAAMPATAATFDFYKLGRGVANGDFLPSDGVACTGGDLCSSNVNGHVLNGDLTFSSGGITLHATGTYNGNTVAAMQDAEGGWNASTGAGAGLGVYHVWGVNSDDNITTGEKLTIHFDTVVELSAIGLRAEGHNFTAWPTGATFLFNGVSTALPDNVGAITGLSLIGQDFTFAYGGTHADQFYLASMTAQVVPEPETYALMLAGLAGVGLMVRRRQQAK